MQKNVETTQNTQLYEKKEEQNEENSEQLTEENVAKPKINKLASSCTE